MDNNERVIRELTIRSFHVDNVVFGEKFMFKKNENNDYFTLTLKKDFEKELLKSESLIADFKISVIKPNERHIMINHLMDVIPISVKALGKIGDGITNTITGAYIMLTGVDTAGNQVCAFGNSDGYMDEKIVFDRPGTPSSDDLIILMEATLKEKEGYKRPGPASVHRLVDTYVDEIRPLLKRTRGDSANESNTYQDVARPGKKKVAVVKLVSGQGAMYDTHYMPKEPSGFTDGRSIIDSVGSPIILSPNEYRDGALRCLYG